MGGVINIMKYIDDVVKKITGLFDVDRIYLFNKKADCFGNIRGFKICVVLDCNDKSDVAKRIYLEVPSEIPYDVVVYTANEWELLKDKVGTFAKTITETGVLLYESSK